MKRAISLLAALMPLLLAAQQGYVPLSRVIDGTLTARMHAHKAPGHSAIRPYARADEALFVADTSAPLALLPVLDRWANDSSRVRFGPLVDLQAGLDAGSDEPFRYRLGAGLWFDADVGRNLTFHLDGMTWNERFPRYIDSLVRATRMTPGEGYAYGRNGSYTHYELNGHVDFAAGKYFRFTLGRGKNFIGDGHRSLFLSDNAYSYPYFKITTTAWRIRYVNLFARMSDIRGAGGDPSNNLKKFASFHYLSWNISKRINFGFFEAIVWQDNDPAYPRGFDINYLNPAVFLRPVEFSLGSPDNALMGFSVNVKVGRRTLIYSQLMLDEFLKDQVTGGEGWYGNKQAFQLGVVGHDVLGARGLTLRSEFNYVRPFMYTHSDTRQNYSHAGEPLAHPYGSNFWEALVQGEWRKDRWLLRELFSVAVMGQDTGSTPNSSYGNNIFLDENSRPLQENNSYEDYGFYIGDSVSVTILHNDLSLGYLVAPRSGMMVELGWTLRSRSPEAGGGLTNFVRVGVAAYFRDRHPVQEPRYVLN